MQQQAHHQRDPNELGRQYNLVHVGRGIHVIE